MSEEMENTEQRMWQLEQEFISFKNYTVSKINDCETRIAKLEVRVK